MMGTIHQTDLRLIQYLQEDPRATIPVISRATGISEATVRRRVDVLFRTGVITSAVIPTIDLLGFNALAYIAIKVDMVQIDEVVNQLKRYPEVATASEIMGRYDVMMFVAVPTILDLRHFVTDRVATLPGVRETETWIVPRIVKLLADWRVPGPEQLAYATPSDDGSDPVNVEET